VTERTVPETTIRAYAAAWAARDREAWLRTFATDGTQEDPVGFPVRTCPPGPYPNAAQHSNAPERQQPAKPAVAGG
jgi:hypothetical protein